MICYVITRSIADSKRNYGFDKLTDQVYFRAISESFNQRQCTSANLATVFFNLRDGIGALNNLPQSAMLIAIFRKHDFPPEGPDRRIG